MPVILNIETSAHTCSVALSAEGMILKHYEEFENRNHATVLSDMIKGCLDFLEEREVKLEAIAVSMGPGSYTGLRIGLSEAKGLAYGLGLPLIGIDTLKLMSSQVMFAREDITEDTIFIPMVDARRMEVYTAAYDMTLEPITNPGPMILDEHSYEKILAMGRPVMFFGDGAEKACQFMTAPNAIYVPGCDPLAVGMVALSELAYSRREFIDLAYSTPNYLKDFQATRPKSLLDKASC